MAVCAFVMINSGSYYQLGLKHEQPDNHSGLKDQFDILGNMFICFLGLEKCISLSCVYIKNEGLIPVLPSLYVPVMGIS